MVILLETLLKKYQKKISKFLQLLEKNLIKKFANRGGVPEGGHPPKKLKQFKKNQFFSKRTFCHQKSTIIKRLKISIFFILTLFPELQNNFLINCFVKIFLKRRDDSFLTDKGRMRMKMMQYESP